MSLPVEGPGERLLQAGTNGRPGAAAARAVDGGKRNVISEPDGHSCEADALLAHELGQPRELLGITAMEKLVGKNRFGELAGQYIIKPEGAPTLVPESDKRPPLNTAAKAAEDFENEPAV